MSEPFPQPARTLGFHYARIRSIIVSILAMRRLWQAALFVSIAAILYLATTSNSYPIPAAPNDKINI